MPARSACNLPFVSPTHPPEDNNVESIFTIGEPSLSDLAALLTRLPTSSVPFSSPQHPLRGMQTTTHRGGDIYPTIRRRAVNCNREERLALSLITTPADARRSPIADTSIYPRPLTTVHHYLRDSSTEIATTSSLLRERRSLRTSRLHSRTNSDDIMSVSSDVSVRRMIFICFKTPPHPGVESLGLSTFRKERFWAKFLQKCPLIERRQVHKGNTIEQHLSGRNTRVTN